jgi:hypothetical protein
MSSRAPVILTKFRNLGEQMKKIVKMSLVAAVAVAGLTAANAKPLEEAIKNVDVSGTVVYRYNDVNTKDASTASNNNYKIGLNLKSKVNDDVTANFRLLTATGLTSTDFAQLDTSSTGDANPSINLSNVYFGYTGIANTTVNVGKQGLTTPWTVAVDSDSNEQTGTGILALSTMGPVTVAAAYFNQTNLGTSGPLAGTLNAINVEKVDGGANVTAGANDVMTVGILGNVGPVALDAWYLDMETLFDTYTVGALAKFDVSSVNFGIDARYTALSLDNDAAAAAGREEDNNMYKIALTAKAGIVDGKLAYAKSDKDGGIVSLDNDATTDIQGWTVNMTGKTDAEFMQAVIGVQALDSLHLSANYVTVEYNDKDVEDTEIYAQAVYNMSKNLSSYVRFGTREVETDSTNTKVESDYMGRLQVQYSF